MKTIIADQSCGFLIDNGRFVRFLSPGTYRFPFWKTYAVKKAAMKGRFADQGIPMECLVYNKNTQNCRGDSPKLQKEIPQ